MLSKQNRLTSEKDILKTRKGESVKSSFFIVNAILNKKGLPKVSITINKKVSLKSTERNLVKRRIAEIVRQNIISNIDCYDVSIFALPNSLKADFKTLKKDKDILFRKLNILKDEKNSDKDN